MQATKFGLASTAQANNFSSKPSVQRKKFSVAKRCNLKSDCFKHASVNGFANCQAIFANRNVWGPRGVIKGMQAKSILTDQLYGAGRSAHSISRPLCLDPRPAWRAWMKSSVRHASIHRGLCLSVCLSARCLAACLSVSLSPVCLSDRQSHTSILRGWMDGWTDVPSISVSENPYANTVFRGPTKVGGRHSAGYPRSDS